MISEEKLLKVLYSPHVSEKASSMMKNRSVVSFNVDVKSTKSDIKRAVEQIFSVNVYGVRTLNVKGKMKKGTKSIGRRKGWKKAYVTLGHGQKIDFVIKLNK